MTLTYLCNSLSLHPGAKKDPARRDLSGGGRMGGAAFWASARTCGPRGLRAASTAQPWDKDGGRHRELQPSRGPTFLPCPFPQEEPEGAEPLNNSALKLLCSQKGFFIYFLTLQVLQFHNGKHFNPKPGPGFRLRGLPSS